MNPLSPWTFFRRHKRRASLLLGLFGLVMLGLKIAAIVQKASESRTVDESGDYTLDQGRDVGKE